jgi:hypothetical protein
MRRALIITLLVALTYAALAQSPNNPPGGFDSKAWLEDFHQVLSEMSAHYANLEWAVTDRRMNLPRLRLDTETKLREAPDETGARRVLDKFLTSFGDGHLEIQWPKSATLNKAAASANQGLCDRMGYGSHLHSGLDFSSLPEFSSLETPESDLFPGGLLRRQDHTVIGVLRIGLLSEHAYPAMCEQAVRDLRLADNAACTGKCEDQLEIATANLLTAALVRRAQSLGSAGATSLLIDITHNGGGSDWVEAASRALSRVPLSDSPMAFVKHEHWTKELEDHLRDVQIDLKNHAASPVPLDRAASTIEKAIEESQQPCDTLTVWETGKLNCSPLVKDLFFTSGEVVAYAKPGNLASLQSGEALFYPSRYAYTENPKALPLYVVVDRDTWSAAEYFAALLQDNHAATIIGEVTGGAGCGYTDGGIPAKLKNSGAQLRMPDCVRFRADGSNEVNGVKPDVLLSWSGHDSDFQRVKLLLAALKSRQLPAANVPSH